MTNKEYVLDAMRRQGRQAALELQERAPELTGTELNAEDGCIPEFQAAKAVYNMLQRPVGFVCRSSAGRVVRLLQSYDSDIYPQEPEELSAQWGFAWSQDPAKAKPFLALSTSPYMTGDCCTEGGAVYRSRIDNNVHSPGDYPAGWEQVEEGTE